jgi:hypothetical protein
MSDEAVTPTVVRFDIRISHDLANKLANTILDGLPRPPPTAFLGRCDEEVAVNCIPHEVDKPNLN